ncbi:light-harvesting protein [Silicimonas sp. MF1-12-2]|jgi:light-harvesting protein B-800-850 alpha chain|uniref:light-harvesting protein n=1 Tax=Silicimonas sp. MF1-12-2 TaxID=3384793 RepID=UPI0039B374D9
MNNAKMWLVVPPAVGVPIFLGAVAVGSFSVHVAVLSNTSWVSDFLSGQPLGSGDKMASMKSLTLEDSQTAQASYALPLENGAQEITVLLPDGTTARAILHPSETMASASPPLIPIR